MTPPCCLENAMLESIREIECNPILPERHFANKVQGVDCVPYLVLKASQTQRLRTSDGVTYDSNVDIAAYFQEPGDNEAMEFRGRMETWAGRNCIELGECGSFCMSSILRSAISDSGGGLVRYNLTFRGMFYAVSGFASESA